MQKNGRTERERERERESRIGGKNVISFNMLAKTSLPPPLLLLAPLPPSPLPLSSSLVVGEGGGRVRGGTRDESLIGRSRGCGQWRENFYFFFITSDWSEANHVKKS